MTPAPAWTEVCARCGRSWTLGDLLWRCRCGGLLDLVGPGGPPPGLDWSEPPTPLVEAGAGIWLKADYELPTGSFKARGASAMIAGASSVGVRRVVVDSSGNAGRAAAFYAGAAGMTAEIFVPAATDARKVSAIESLGASVVVVPGDREATAAAAQARLREGGAWYASHAYQPLFFHGVKGLAAELHAQLGAPPATVVVPAGNGTLVLGLWLGFRELGRVPALVAVQASRCAPLAGMRPAGPTAATGIAVASPPRAMQVRAGVVASGGKVVTVSEDEIGAARLDLEGRGFDVESTGAVGWAAWQAGLVPDRGPTVIVLTGRPNPG